MSDKSTGNEQPAAATEPVPSRSLGLTFMLAVIAFVAYWMFGHQEQLPSGESQDVAVATVAGFRADAWMLPEDENLGFVPIPAGPFIMGSNPVLDRLAYPNERWSESRRQGEPTLPLYYMGRYEVTRAQFAVFQRETHLAPNVDTSGQPGNLPVTGVTLPEALAYARWLDGHLRESALTPDAIKTLLDGGARVTLPDEAEWEKAARSTDGRIFPWGSQPQSGLANFESGSLQPVGSIDCVRCAYGLSDMSGNVWELTRSPLQDYPFGAGNAATDLSEAALWVMRGGSYSDSLGNVRAAVRGGVDPGVRNPTIGFRLAISTR